MMEAGRELDALVAEKVMGLDVLGFEHFTPAPECYGYYLPFDGPEKSGVYIGAYVKHCACKHKEEQDHLYFGHIAACLAFIPAYSIYIADAWSVFEHLRNTGNYCCLDIKSDFNFVYDVTWVLADDGEHIYHSLDYSVESAPLAICLAALKAEGITIPTIEPDPPR